MNRSQWIGKIELLNKLVEMGDITSEIRTDVIENLIDDERKEWDKIDEQHMGIERSQDDN